MKKQKSGSAKSVNSGPDALKEKASKVPRLAAPAPNALTRLLARNKNVEASAAAVTPPSAAAAASAKEHVSVLNCFGLPLLCFGFCFPPK